MLFKFAFTLPIILFWLKNTKEAHYLLRDSIFQSSCSVQVIAKQQLTFLSILIFCSLFVIQTFFTLIIHWRDDTIFGHLPPVQSHLSLLFLNSLSPTYLEIMPLLIVKPFFFFSETHKMPPLLYFCYTLIAIALWKPDGKIKTFEDMATFSAQIPSNG